MPPTFQSTLFDILNVTVIPDGDNQTRSSNGDASFLFLPEGNSTTVQDAPAAIIDDDMSIYLGEGDAATIGDAAALEISGDRSLGVIFPTGSVMGTQDGAVISGEMSAVLNGGLLSGGVNAIRLLGPDNGFINFGTATSDSRVVDIVGEGAFVANYGRLVGTDDQRNGTVYADNAAEDINILNFAGGLIDAGRGNDGVGISLELGDEVGEAVEISVINEGRVVGRGDAPEGVNTNGDGIRLFAGVDGASADGSLTNEGVVVSNSARGIEVSDGLGFAGDIVNTGRIFGETDGLYVGDAIHALTITNQGRILSDSRAVNIDGTGVELANFGRIAGTGDQRNGTVYADSTAEDYDILNGVGGRIDAGRGNDGSGVSLQTGDVDGDVVAAELANQGIIRGRGDAGTGNEIGDAVRIFSDVADAVFQGSILNSGRLLATNDSDEAVGIRIEDGVALDGRIVNDGWIVANEVAIDATDAGGDVRIVNRGEIVGDVALGAGDDVFNGTQGRVAGTVDGGDGDDRLRGGAFSDTIEGGAGNDTLSGGAGSDVFNFGPADAPGIDVITDFQIGIDVIDVTAFGFSDVGDIGLQKQGGDVLVTFAADNGVLLEELTIDVLGTGDFSL